MHDLLTMQYGFLQFNYWINKMRDIQEKSLFINCYKYLDRMNIIHISNNIIDFLNPGKKTFKSHQLANIVMMSQWNTWRKWRRISKQEWVSKGVNARWVPLNRDPNIGINKGNKSNLFNYTRPEEPYGDPAPEGPGDKVGKGPSTLERDLIRNIRGIYK